jgi:hypothetical protein
MHTEFWSRNLKERDKLEEIGIDERNIKMVLNYVADDGDSWWALVFPVLELRVQYNAENILIILCLVESLWVELSLAEEHKFKIRLFYSKILEVFGPPPPPPGSAVSQDNCVVYMGHLAFMPVSVGARSKA